MPGVLSTDADSELKGYCEKLIRFIATQMLDPHRYFEQKLLGELGLAASPAARAALLSRLVGWIDSGELLTAAQRRQLDAELAGHGWPSTVLAARDAQAVALLLQQDEGQTLSPRLRTLLSDRRLGETDRALLLSRLEQAES